MLSALALAAALQVTPAQLQRLRWVPNPRTQNGSWVADPSRHLRPTTIDSLNAIIGSLEHETGVEIAVVVVDSTSGLEPFDFGLALHRGWGVGKRGKDNGVVFLWVPTQRAVHISVGTGLEGVLPDRRAGRIRDEEIFPAFRRGAFDEGVLAGVRALAAAAREETSARQGITPRLERGSGAAAPARERTGGGGGLGALVAIFGGLGAAAVAIVGGARYRRRRPRPCPNGHGMMRLLDEGADDARLDEGSRLEEQLKSVDWDVWVCDTCGHTQRIAHRRWFSSFEDCPECKRRTVTANRRTVRQATTLNEGLAHVTKTCKSCGWTREYDEAIARRTAASVKGAGSSRSRGGGGGSSFGGGSAGGGGAGGRY